MSPYSSKNSNVGSITIAALNSFGIYNVSYKYAENGIWGRNKGCDFLNSSMTSKF